MEEDRMSQLPDKILLLILDKIDTFEAVKTTSLLSHRWKNLWRSVSALRFRFHIPSGCLRSEEFLPKILSQCQRVSQFLSHRDAAAAVHDFHLSVDSPGYVNREFMEEWVLYAINHGVQSLRLHWPTKQILRLPAAFLTCETLRELELRNPFGSVKLPRRLSLPNLKTFHLETLLVFDDDDISMEPFSGLPELEKLILINYPVDGLVINAPKLRVLEIASDFFVGIKEISAPLLTSFRYEAPKAWECAEVNLPMLEQAHLDIHETSYRYRYNQNHSNFVSMLHQLRNATTVSLTMDTIEILQRKAGSFEQTPPPFLNIKCLKVMEGRRGIRTVLQSVMYYLIRTLECEVELSPSLYVVE